MVVSRRTGRGTASRRSRPRRPPIVVLALLGYEHAIVRPDDLRRLDAAFFTVNGIISVVFFVFVALDVVA